MTVGSSVNFQCNTCCCYFEFLSKIGSSFFQLVGFAELQSRFVSQDLKMRYVAAAALAALGGQDVNEANIKKILR